MSRVKVKLKEVGKECEAMKNEVRNVGGLFGEILPSFSLSASELLCRCCSSR